uniref:DRBM domain-containing protein n=1 Tax=Nelumbo nucifera TaxID=4432 RepID=A0A822YJW1_NELNU|nr:TPA_asm: hypothetical protein HUJ06_011648 [Nelumbo nucifera]
MDCQDDIVFPIYFKSVLRGLLRFLGIPKPMYLVENDERAYNTSLALTVHDEKWTFTGGPNPTIAEAQQYACQNAIRRLKQYYAMHIEDVNYLNYMYCSYKCEHLEGHAHELFAQVYYSIQ